MEINKIIDKIKLLSSKKLELSFIIFLLGFKNYNYSVDPITKLITNFEEIKKVLEFKEQIIFEYFYFNRNNIKKILYENDKFVDVGFIE